jgi:hypothetical protein
VPAYESGTGNFNRELLYAWANDGWRDVDVTSWLDELKPRLPKGLGILKGVYPDYATMTAETPVWRGRPDLRAGRTGPCRLEVARRSDRGGQRSNRQGWQMRRTVAALSLAKGTNLPTGSF